MQICSMCTAAHAAEQEAGGLSDFLETPTPFAAADVIAHDDSGRLSFHYTIVEVSLIGMVLAPNLQMQRRLLALCCMLMSALMRLSGVSVCQGNCPAQPRSYASPQHRRT